jgi:cob(I)alamin adenosyltransferase
MDREITRLLRQVKKDLFEVKKEIGTYEKLLKYDSDKYITLKEREKELEDLLKKLEQYCLT